MSLDVTIVRQPLLEEGDRVQMFDLHRRYFVNVHRDVFFRDMGAKDWVILLRNPEGTVVGFSTVLLVELDVDGEACVFLFSGDTVVDREYRQRGVLAGAFGHVMLRALDDYPGLRCYWFLISKGYRTYRFLPLYFRRFYPTCAAPTPPRYKLLLDVVGRHLLGGAYDAGAGIVRHAGVGDRLAPAACLVPDGREADPFVQFFLTRNPDYALGDELACITDVARDNFRPACDRVIDRTHVNWLEGT